MDGEQVNVGNLINADELKYLLSDFSDMTGFIIGLADVVTNEFLLKVGSCDICTEFHRTHPESEAYSEESNKRLTAGLKQAGEIRIDHCANGLIDACTPIIVRGKHLANLFAGQVLFSPPDLEQFRSQAKKLGYDEQRYLENLVKVPIVDEERMLSILRYLSKKITFISQTNLDLLNTHSENMKQKNLLKHIAGLAPVGIGVAQNRTIQWSNRAMSQITGYSNEELTGLKGETLYPSPEAFVLAGEDIKAQFQKSGKAFQEIQLKKKDGSLFEVYVNSAPLNEEGSSLETIFTVLDVTEQVKQGEILKESEERLTLALEAANLGLWDCNLVTGDSYYNENYFTMLGYQVDEFPHTFETWKKLLHPDDLEKSLSKVETTLSSDNPENIMEFRMLSASGDYRWILGYARIVEYSHNGIPLRAIGIHQDITSQKKDEQNLRDKEEKYRELFNNMSSGVAICKVVENGNGFVIEEVNNAALKIKQLTLKKVLGKEVTEVFPNLETLGLLDMFRRVYKTGTPESRPFSHYQSEVRDLWLDHYVHKLPSGRIVVIFNDITEKKRAEEELEKQRVQLEQIIDLAADAFCLGDHEGTIINVNQQATALSGYSRDELLGQNLSFLFSKEELKKSPLDFTLLKTGGVLMKERELLRKNGTIISIEIHSKMMPDGSYQSFIRDISRRKRSQNDLLKSQNDLQKKRLQLEETNTALKVLVKNAEQEKLELEEAIAANILSLVEPHLNKLKKSGINNSQANSIKIIESTLNDLVSPFVRTSVAMNLKLSPAEIQVANLIKQGKTSKQIAELLGLSPQTIDKHRSHIRKKIGVTNKDISLRELLTSRS